MNTSAMTSPLQKRLSARWALWIFQNKIAVFTLFFGLILVFAIPPFQVPDEQAHFFRIYQLSEFRLLPDELGTAGLPYTSLPKSLERTVVYLIDNIPFNYKIKFNPEKIWPALSFPLEPDNETLLMLGSISTYSPAAYLAALPAFWIGRLLEQPPVVMLYLGRIFNLLAYTWLLASALRLFPAFRNILLLTALSPMALFLAASLSADSLTNGLAFLFTALVLRAAYLNNTPVRARFLGVLIGLGVLLSLSKYIYGVFILLFFLIPASKFSSKKRYLAAFALMFLIAFGSVLGWIAYTQEFSHLPNPALNAQMTYEENMSIKTEFIRSHPLDYLKLNFRTLDRMALGYYVKTSIGVLGWLDTPFPRWYYELFALFFLVTAAFSSLAAPFQVSLKDRAMALLSICSVTFSLLLIEYLLWTDPHNQIIEGIQGRYFIPAILPGCVLVYLNFEWKNKIVRVWDRLVPPFLVFSQTLSLYLLWARYYGA